MLQRYEIQHGTSMGNCIQVLQFLQAMPWFSHILQPVERSMGCLQPANETRCNLNIWRIFGVPWLPSWILLKVLNLGISGIFRVYFFCIASASLSADCFDAWIPRCHHWNAGAYELSDRKRTMALLIDDMQALCRACQVYSFEWLRTFIMIYPVPATCGLHLVLPILRPLMHQLGHRLWGRVSRLCTRNRAINNGSASSVSRGIL